jgi:hypothetical protein
MFKMLCRRGYGVAFTEGRVGGPTAGVAECLARVGCIAGDGGWDSQLWVARFDLSRRGRAYCWLVSFVWIWALSDARVCVYSVVTRDGWERWMGELEVRSNKSQVANKQTKGTV